MTNELEKQFFDTFGIEPKFKGYSNTEELSNGGVIPCGNIKYFNTIEEMDKANYWCFNMWELGEEDKEYPQITDRILLELICILSKQGIYLEDMDSLFKMKTYETSMVMQNADNLKDVILKTVETACRLSKDDNLKQQVRTLFKES